MWIRYVDDVFTELECELRPLYARPQLQWELRLLYSSPPAVYQTQIKASAAVGTPNSLQNFSQSFPLFTGPPPPPAVYDTCIRVLVTVRHPIAVYRTQIRA